MELLPLTVTASPSTSSFSAALGHFSSKLCDFHPRKNKRMSLSLDGGAKVLKIRSVKASAEQSSESIEDGDGRCGFNEADFPVWEKIGAVVRLSYGIGHFLFSHLSNFGLIAFLIVLWGQTFFRKSMPF